MVKIGLYLGAANFSVALLSLLRNVLIARLVSVEDFGIASTFAIVMAVVEMTSNIALDRLIVQARDGETPLLQATLQAIQAIRGALGALVLFLIAGPLASLFGIPEVTWAYQIMAVIPLLRGLVHLDMFRLQREMRFLPSVAVEFVAQFISTAAAVPLALELGDYRAMLWALVLQQFAFTVTSHVVAGRSYRLAWNGEIVRRAIVFGWPLLLNGLLMFGILQGDRIIVGSLIGMTELGWFSAAYLLTLVPSLVLAKTLQSLFLPQLSRAEDNMAEFYRLSLVSIQAGLFMGLALAIFFALAGPSVLIGLYSVKYEAALSVLVWLAVMQALRVAKATPAIVALSKAQTDNPLMANVIRFLTLPIAGLLVSQGAGVLTVVVTGILGEGLAFAVSLLLLKRRLLLPLSGLRLPLIVTLGALVLICLDAMFWPPGPHVVQNLHFAQVALMLTLALLWWSMPTLRQWVFGADEQRT